GSAWDAYAPFRAYLASEGIDESTIAGAAVFTAGNALARARTLALAALAAPAPKLSDLTLCDTGVVSPCQDASGRGACGAADPNFFEIHGRFTVPIFQQGTEPYIRPADGGAISNPPVVQRIEAVCFALTIPKNAAMPVGGWPLVVLAHGTGGSFR